MLSTFRSWTVFNAVIKLFGYGSIFLIADTLLPNLYINDWFAVYTVIVLTLVGTVADVVILPRLGNLPSLCLGFVGMTVIIWAIAHLDPYNRVGWLAAFILALCLGPLEFGLHEVMLRALGYRQQGGVRS
ncbi:MAG: YndM family protein [Alicyclobacillus herbarius]|uniref:DUF2512 family protein n=1 Tax=Alicyclobacillus herbarius TaxID=122960 RepID=UPI000411994E|nr:DUF2512 family protein [Alicyclobacillus herbarius]MCL6632956.1 YndM family protein [Alicyclobacillus herbarius]